MISLTAWALCKLEAKKYSREKSRSGKSTPVVKKEYFLRVVVKYSTFIIIINIDFKVVAIFVDYFGNACLKTSLSKIQQSLRFRDSILVQNRTNTSKIRHFCKLSFGAIFACVC